VAPLVPLLGHCLLGCPIRGLAPQLDHVEMAKKFKAVSKLPVLPLAAA
jgi:hypothetical protein